MILYGNIPVSVVKNEMPGLLTVTIEMPDGQHKNIWPGLLKGTSKGLDEILLAERIISDIFEFESEEE